MRPLYSLSNHVCGLTAEAVETCTHADLFPIARLTFRRGNSTCIPTKFFVSYPALLSTGRGNPHCGSTLIVNDGQSPFGFKLQNFGIANALGSKRVYHFDRLDTQNHLGFDPDTVNNYSKDKTKYNFENRLKCVSTYKDAVCTKEDNKYIGTTGPSKVTSRSKSFIHSLSIAGETK